MWAPLPCHCSPSRLSNLSLSPSRLPTAGAKPPWSIRRYDRPGRSPPSGSRSAVGTGSRPWRTSWRGRPAGLGVTEPIVADFYKLLVYDTDSFFVRHRDTEKAAGMFATLLIVLPSLYTGGVLLVRHRDREVRLELNCLEPSQVAFAAFYADCVHEVLPLTSGYRLALVYNLRRQGRGQLPQPPNYDTEQANVTALLQQWSAGKNARDDDSPEKLLYPLEHAYTPAELAFDALKGADAAAAAVLIAAASAADCDLYLALVSIKESGSAESTGYSGSRRPGGRMMRMTRTQRTSRSLRSTIGPRPCPTGGVQTAASRLWGPYPLRRRTLSTRSFRRPGVRRAAFPRGHRERRRLLRAHLSPSGPRVVAAGPAACRPQSGRSGCHPTLSGCPDRALGREWRRSRLPPVA